MRPELFIYAPLRETTGIPRPQSYGGHPGILPCILKVFGGPFFPVEDVGTLIIGITLVNN